MICLNKKRKKGVIKIHSIFYVFKNKKNKLFFVNLLFPSEKKKKKKNKKKKF